MMLDDSFGTIIIRKMVQNLCNNSTTEIVDDMIGSSVEATQSLLLLSSDDYQSLPKHLETFAQRYTWFKQAGGEFATSKLRDACAQEPLARGKDKSLAHEQVLVWKNASFDGYDDTDAESFRRALNETFRARICIKRSVQGFEQFYRDLRNVIFSKAREQPCNTSDFHW